MRTQGKWETGNDGCIYVKNKNGYCDGGYDRIALFGGCQVTVPFEESNGNLEFACKAVNMHDELVEALEPFANFACDDWETHGCFNCIAKRAFTKAKEK